MPQFKNFLFLLKHKQQIGHAQKEWGDTHIQLEEYRHRLNELSKLQKEASNATKSQLDAANEKVELLQEQFLEVQQQISKLREQNAVLEAENAILKVMENKQTKSKQNICDIQAAQGPKQRASQTHTELPNVTTSLTEQVKNQRKVIQSLKHDLKVEKERKVC